MNTRILKLIAENKPILHGIFAILAGLSLLFPSIGRADCGCDTYSYISDTYEYGNASTGFNSNQIISNPAGLNYIPITSYYASDRYLVSGTVINPVPSSLASGQSIINYDPSTLYYSGSRDIVSQSRTDYYPSQIASVASTIKYSPTTTQLPIEKRVVVRPSVIIAQTASVASVTLPKLPKTGGGGKAKILKAQKISLVK